MATPERIVVSQRRDATTPGASNILETDIVRQMTGLSLEQEPYKPKFMMAKRLDDGKMGKDIALEANYFSLKFGDIRIYHYDIDICEVDKYKNISKSLMSKEMTAKKAIAKKVNYVEHQQKKSMGKKKCREIISQMLHKPEFAGFSPVYDGQKNIYTRKLFPIHSKKVFNVDLNVEGQDKSFCVILQPVNRANGTNHIDLEPLREMYNGRSREVPDDIKQALDTIMTHRDPPLTQVQVRNSFFAFQQLHKVNLGSGLEAWFGYNQSVHFAQRGPVVVINSSAKAFLKPVSVISHACEVLGCDVTRIPKLNDDQIKRLSNSLSKVKVEVIHQKIRRRYHVKGVSKLPAQDIYQKINDRDVSVAEFFAEKYITLQYPNLPCLLMRATKVTYIPMENCVIFENQPKIGKLDAALASTMIRHTATPPGDRFKSITKDVKIVTNLGKTAMQSFGLSMDTEFMKVKGRVLTSPVLLYDNRNQTGSVSPDSRGVWRMDGKKFYRPKAINNWIIISFSQIPTEQLEKFASCLSTSCKKLGFALGRLVEIKVFSQRDETRSALIYAKKRAELAVVVLSRKDRSHNYEEVKFIADFELNLVTQCMEDKNIYRISPNNDQITNNICLKLNLKLGGINHILNQKPRIFTEPVIIFGADAIHWPRGFGYPSIAAVVGSLDPIASSYALACRVQENVNDKKISQEIIRDMKDIVKEILKAFYDKNNRLPVRIIFFRDGVSVGQFSTVLQQEVSSIQEAAMEQFRLTTPIPTTYIIVQKRHQTRLRPKFAGQGIGKMGNVPPGTVVDTDIVHPVFNDYFLCSHEGIQGTSKPARYTVIHDDNYLQPDELQQLSFHLCYLYGKCNRSVSVPAPVLYADLACERAKRYADHHIADDQSSSSSSESTQRKLPDKVMSAINAMKSFPQNFFYI